MNTLTLDRRTFLLSAAAIAGGGLALTIALRKPGAAEASEPWGPEAATAGELSAWIEITPDNTITIRSPTPEIGNGAMTQVAMNIAEELHCDWSHVRVQFCSVRRDFVENGVYSSGYLPFFGGHGTDSVRMQHALQLGASARERLKAAAAARWRAPVEEIEARDSVLTHTPSRRRLRYGEVAADAAGIALEVEPALKPQSEWTLLGKASPPKLNIPAITTGKAIFGIDVQAPGMVHATLKQSPVHGGRLKTYNPDAVLGMPGVRAVVVIDPAKTRGAPAQPPRGVSLDASGAQSAVAVIADHYWQAKLALDALPVEWESGAGAQWSSETDIYDAARALRSRGGARMLRQSGNVRNVRGSVTVEQEYATPYAENAAIEPLNGTALVTPESVTVWCPTQDMQQAFWVAVDETGVAPEHVSIHQTFVGGGFGRRTQADDVRMVVAIAKEFPGVPVKTIWSREECFAQGRYRTPIVTSFRATLGADGYPQAVTSHTSFVGTNPRFQLTMGYDDAPYFTSGAIPNVRFSASRLPLHIQNGAYRAPCYNSHVFIVETFIDECAVAAGIDPLEYRLHLVQQWDAPWSDCLRVAAEKSGWGQPLPAGEGRGIAISCWPAASQHNFGTVVCAVARVAVSDAGEIDVRQIDVAFDCGRIANADAVRAQIEGATIYGMNMTLNEQLTVKDGAIVETNFHQYPMLRLGDRLPRINVHFDAVSGHERFQMVGEAPVGPPGPAIGNAIFQATGKRLRSTPFVNHELSRT